MRKIMSSNELFKIILVEIPGVDKSVESSYYELVEGANTIIETFVSYSIAEQVMKQKTEDWKTIIKKIPLYFEVRFIA